MTSNRELCGTCGHPKSKHVDPSRKARLWTPTLAKSRGFLNYANMYDFNGSTHECAISVVKGTYRNASELEGRRASPCACPGYRLGAIVIEEWA